MTIEECYEKMGGNYADVTERIPGVGLIERFVGRFLEDKSFDTLCSQIECGDREEAFRAAHTLKGVCANLGFARLYDSASKLTEELRGDAASVSGEARALLEKVRQDYEVTSSAIREYMDQK